MPEDDLDDLTDGGSADDTADNQPGQDEEQSV